MNNSTISSVGMRVQVLTSITGNVKAGSIGIFCGMEGKRAIVRIAGNDWLFISSAVRAVR